MCYYIAVVVPAAKAEELFSSSGSQFDIEPLSNQSIMALLPAGYALFTLSRDGCGCGLYSVPKDPKQPEEEVAALRRKYEKRGWSEAKISRALQAVSMKSRARSCGGIDNEVAEYLQAVCVHTSRLAILPFFCGGPLEDEKIALSQKVSCRSSDLPTAGALLEVNSLLQVSDW